MILAQDVSGVLLELDGALERGFEGDVILEGMAEHLRNLLLCKDARMAKLLDVPNEHKPVYHEKAGQAPPSFIISSLNVVNDAELNYKNANNKRLHVEMALIRLCYVLHATQEVVEKKNSSVAPKQPEFSAPPPQQSSIPQPPPTAAPPANNAPIQQSVVNEPRETYQQPSTQPQPEPVRPQAPAPTAQSSVAQPNPAKQGVGKARRIRKDLMDEIDNAVNNASSYVAEDAKELTQEWVDGIFAEYIEKAKLGNKSMLYAQLLLMSPKVIPPDEICLVVPTDLTNTYALNERDVLLDFFREKTGLMMIRITTDIQLDENIEERQQARVLSKNEVLDAMIQKNPELGRLKDGLNLQIEY